MESSFLDESGNQGKREEEKEKRERNLFFLLREDGKIEEERKREIEAWVFQGIRLKEKHHHGSDGESFEVGKFLFPDGDVFQ